jgi:mannose-6-phosphate isomerase
MTAIETPHRPWGFFEILADESDHRVTRITMNPGARLSLQRHQRRFEHWYVLAGEAEATLGDRRVLLTPGSSLDIPVKTVHRIENRTRTPFVFIEIQRGEYFGDDDIERFEDDYGRV